MLGRRRDSACARLHNKNKSCLLLTAAARSPRGVSIPAPTTPLSASRGIKRVRRQGMGMNHDLEWNAGELACGDLVLELRRRLRSAPGKVMKLIALDAGAPSDLPAWCGMTGHALLDHDPQEKAYWIRAKS